jgi:hypothetical protein
MEPDLASEIERSLKPAHAHREHRNQHTQDEPTTYKVHAGIAQVQAAQTGARDHRMPDKAGTTDVQPRGTKRLEAVVLRREELAVASFACDSNTYTSDIAFPSTPEARRADNNSAEKTVRKKIPNSNQH